MTVTDAMRSENADQISGTLGSFVEFKNGRSSPERMDSGSFSVYGSNGEIGKADVTNAPEGTLVVGRVGSYCGSVHFSRNKCWVTDNAIIGNSKSLKDSRFWFYKLTSLDLNSYRSGSGQPLLNQQILNSVQVSVPASEDARFHIASVLAAFDEKVDLNRNIIQTLETMAQAIFKSWFVDFDPVKAKIAAKAEGRDPLRAAMSSISGKPDAELNTLPLGQLASLEATAALFPDAIDGSELGAIPSGWRLSTIGERCVYLNRGISPKYIDQGGVLVLNQKCIRDFRIDTSKGRRHDSHQRSVSGRELQLGDVLVNSTGVGTLGRVAQVLRLDEPTIVDSHVTVVRSGANLNSAYLGQWFVTKQADIEAMGEGSTGQTELSRGKLASMSVLVPDLAVLSAFAAVVAPLQSFIATRARESLTLQETRDALLPRFLSGELSPTVALEGTEV